MAALVQADTVRKVSGKGSHLGNVVKELAQLINTMRERGMLGLQAFFQMQDATAGGGDDVVKGGVFAGEVRDAARAEFGETRIRHRLATAGGLLRHLHPITEAGQQGVRGLTDLRVELVNVAGDEEADRHACIVYAR